MSDSTTLDYIAVILIAFIFYDLKNIYIIMEQQCGKSVKDRRLGKKKLTVCTKKNVTVMMRMARTGRGENKHKKEAYEGK